MSEWARSWGASATVRLADDAQKNGSLRQFMQAPSRSYVTCMGKLACGHGTGLRADSLWLLTVLVDLVRAGAEIADQSAVAAAAGLSRSNGKRALAELSRSGFLDLAGDPILIRFPTPGTVTTNLTKNCPKCAPPTPVTDRLRWVRPIEAPEWADAHWWENLKKRVGKERAELAVRWVEHRISSGHQVGDRTGRSPSGGSCRYRSPSLCCVS